MQTESSNTKKLIISVTIILIIAFGVWYFFFRSTTVAPTYDEAGNPIQAEVVGKDLIDLLTELQSVKLDSSVLRTAAFTSLVDYSIGLPDLPLGRNNPFEKISGSVSTPVVAPKTQVKR